MQRRNIPGQKVQIDVKYVPKYCVAGDTKYYQYTAIDEYSRLVYRERYNRFSNTIPKVCLGYKSPNEVLAEYQKKAA